MYKKFNCEGIWMFSSSILSGSNIIVQQLRDVIIVRVDRRLKVIVD